MQYAPCPVPLDLAGPHTRALTLIGAAANETEASVSLPYNC